MNCKNMDHERRLKEQFINGLDDENIVEEIIKELVALNNASEVRSKQILWDL